MAEYKFIVAFSLVLVVSPFGLGQDEILPGCPPSPPCNYNPVNTITINNCCNKTDQDDVIFRELQSIKALLNTIQTSLENGDYCCEASKPRDCYEVQQSGETASGVYTIQPDGSNAFEVYCDMDTDGGGWTIFQRREDGSVDFYLGWDNYEEGFGSLEGEHWLGNEKLYYLTNQKAYKLRVDLGDFDDATRYALYDSFVISDASDKYRLTLGSYTGDAGDALTYHNGQQFSTRDQDNDVYSGECANLYKGGWWYRECHHSNLNGPYLVAEHSSYADGVNWYEWRGHHYSLKLTELKLRPV